jgi:non-lysosomal glucosylceramidase
VAGAPDDFSDDGQLGPEAFVLAWRFPNRTPAWSGWTAPGEEHATIGNHYCTRFEPCPLR